MKDTSEHVIPVATTSVESLSAYRSAALSLVLSVLVGTAVVKVIHIVIKRDFE